MIKSRQLDHALTLSRLGNYSRAAMASNLTQPAFSRSIRSLEKELGVKLFDRDRNRVIPTKYGEILLLRAEEIITQTEELEREIRLAQGLHAGYFGIALAQYPAELSAGKALGRLAHEHPEIRICVIQNDWLNVTEHVLSRKVDLGFAEISIAKADERFETELVGQHKLALFCRTEHPLADQKKVTREELDQYPLVAVRVPGRLVAFPGMGHIDKETGYLVPSIDSPNLAIARSIVADSNAFGVMTPMQIGEDLKTGKFKVLQFWEPWMHLNYGFISLRGRTMSPAAALFMALVKEREEDIRARSQQLFEKYLGDFGA